MPSPVYNNFQNLITFSRASNATLVDATGRITYAPSNIILQSQTFQTGWVASSLNTTGTPPWVDVAVAPDGTTTAEKLIESTANAPHFIYQSVAFPAGTFIASVYAKAAERTSIEVSFAGTAFTGSGKFNLSAGTATSVGAATAAISDAGNGWYRCSIRTTGAAAETAQIRIFIVDANNYVGNGTSGVFIWGAQLEAVTYQTSPSTYNPTTTAAYYGPRLDYDPATLALKGLLVEEARTNLLTYSEQFDNAAWTTLAQNATVTANAAVAPDGTTTADRFVENTANNFHIIQQNYTTSTSGNYAFSFFAKANSSGRYAYVQLTVRDPNARRYSAVVDLSTGAVLGTATFQSPTGTSILVTAAGNGWYRIVLTSTAIVGLTQISTYIGSANSATFDANTFVQYTGDGTSGLFIWGAQLEAGAFATSYIPTVAASVARSADIASMTGSQFAPWYNQTAGTFVVNASGFNKAGQYADVFITQNIQVAIGNGNWRVYNGTTNGFLQGFGVAVDGVFAKVAVACTPGASSSAGSLNGAATATFTNPDIVSTSLNIGGPAAAGGTPNYLNGHIKTITYYPRRLSDTQLQSLTS